MKTYVILVSVGNFDRNQMEEIENQIFNSYEELIACIKPSKCVKPLERFFVMGLTDFMELWNNEDDDLRDIKNLIDGHWLGYVQVKEPKDIKPKCENIENDNYSLTVGKLINVLKVYPKYLGITTEQNQDLIHIVNDDERVIISSNKPIGTCNRTDTYVYPSVIDGYTAFCPELDEDLSDCEWTNFDLFNDLDKVIEPLRSLIKWHINKIDIVDVKDAKILLQTCQAYDYTFDISEDSCSLTLSNLRQK